MKREFFYISLETRNNRDNTWNLWILSISTHEVLLRFTKTGSSLLSAESAKKSKDQSFAANIAECFEIIGVLEVIEL